MPETMGAAAPNLEVIRGEQLGQEPDPELSAAMESFNLGLRALLERVKPEQREEILGMLRETGDNLKDTAVDLQKPEQALALMELLKRATGLLKTLRPEVLPKLTTVSSASKMSVLKALTWLREKK